MQVQIADEGCQRSKWMTCWGRNLLLILLLANPWTVPHLAAHRANYCLSELTWRVEQRNLEVVHSVHLDDAVVLLAALGNPHGNLTPATEARLLEYLQATFTLQLHGEVVVLTTLGAQIDGDNLWLFQEAQLPEFPAGLQVTSGFLFDLFPDQSHQINLQIGNHVDTRLLDRQTNVGQF